MRLKRYIDFIKESAQEEKSLWRHSDEDFKWYLTEFTDNGYTVEIHRLFMSEYQENIGTWSNPKYNTIDIVTDLLTDTARECYVIQITETPGATGGDVSEALYFAKGTIEGEMGMKCEIMLNDDRYDEWRNYRPVEGEDVRILDGEIERLSDETGFDDVCIACYYDEDLKFSPQQMLDYYGWDSDVLGVDGKPAVRISEKDGLWVRLDQEDLSGIIDWKGSEVGEDSLLSGVETYYHHDTIDTDSLIRYHLNDEAKRALVKFLISMAGGLEEFVNGIETDLDLEGMDEAQVIDEIVGERFERTLVSAAEEFGGDTWDDICREWSDWSALSEADKYDTAVQDAFDDKLEGWFYFQKDEYRTEFKGGNNRFYSLFFYWILIEDKMISELANEHDYELRDIKNIGVRSLPMEWFSRCGEDSKIYVRDQYGDVDEEEFSKHVISEYLG